MTESGIESVSIEFSGGVHYLVSARWQTVTIIDEKIGKVLSYSISEFLEVMERSGKLQKESESCKR